MGFLFLGLDSLIAGIAIGPLVRRRVLLPLAALFGVADAVAFLVGLLLPWQIQISDTLSLGLQTGMLVGLGIYLIAVGAFARPFAGMGWPMWVLPFALTFDNVAFGLASHEGAVSSAISHAGQQALSSALLGLVGLLVAVLIQRVIPVLQRRPAIASGASGGALVVTAGVLVLMNGLGG